MKSIQYIITVILVSLSLSSCGIYTSYKRPMIVTDGLYRTDRMSDTQIADTTGNMGNLPWRELFGDSLLQNHIETGLRQNTDLRIAQLRVDQAQAMLRAAKLSYLPTLSFAPQGGISGIEGQKSVWTHDEMLAANWEVDIFGKVRNANAAQRALLEQSMGYRQAVQSSLVSTIAINYYTLMMLHRQLEVSEQTLTNWSENVRTLRAMKNAGMTTEAAIAHAEGNYFQVEASVSEIKQQIFEMENTFSALLGNMPGQISVNTASENEGLSAIISTGVPMQLLSYRPDVRQAESVLKAAFNNTNSARASFYPSITLSGNAGWSNSVGGMIVNPSQFLASAIGSLVQPLFMQGRLTAQLRVAQAQQEEASLLFQQTLLDAGVEVNNALSAFQTSKMKSESFANQVGALENAVKNTQLLMQHGNNTYLEVLTAQQALLAAKLAQIENDFSESRNLIVLYRALGGGATGL